MTDFIKDNISIEDSFWIMWYFLQEHYELTDGKFDLSGILSACEPMDWFNDNIKRPADNGMIEFWNEAYEKYKKEGIPNWKQLRK